MGLELFFLLGEIIRDTSQFLYQFLYSLFLLLANAFRRDKDVPEFVVINEGFFPFYPGLFHNSHQMPRIVLVKTVDAEDIVC